MRPEVSWNLAGLSPDAREAARTAARREGLPVGEWLARQSLRGSSPPDRGPIVRDLGNAALAHEERMAGPQRHEDQIRRLKEEPADAATALGRVEEQLRALARSIE